MRDSRDDGSARVRDGAGQHLLAQAEGIMDELAGRCADADRSDSVGESEVDQRPHGAEVRAEIGAVGGYDRSVHALEHSELPEYQYQRAGQVPYVRAESHGGTAPAGGPAYARRNMQPGAWIVMLDGSLEPGRVNWGNSALLGSEIFSPFCGQLPRAAQHENERAGQNRGTDKVVDPGRIGAGSVAQEPHCIGADKAAQIAERVDQANAGR